MSGRRRSRATIERTAAGWILTSCCRHEAGQSSRHNGLKMDDDELKRSAKRDSLFLLAELSALNGTPIAAIRVRNLSATGLMADCTAALAQNDRVTVALRGINPITATVTWVKGGRLGLEFETEIDPLAVRRTVGSSGEAGGKRPGGATPFNSSR